MSTGTNDARPLSPHLQVWRWHLTMATSILHRASGMALYAGTALLTVWLFAIASGPEAYAAIEGFLLSWIGRGLLFAFTAAAMYHLANGVRHLVWDAGKGFAPGTATMSGALAIVAAAFATLAIWIAAYAA